MKKYFKVIGFLTLMIFSFFYTAKTATVVKNLDDIMIQIKDNQDSYKIDSIDATIDGNTIIPGLAGKEVDINKSYDVMKKVGSYSSKLLEYKSITPNISIKNNYNKYIIKGNPNKNQVSLLFKVNDDDDISKIVKILNDNNIKATFFLDGNWFSSNNNLVLSLIKQGHNIGNMGYNLNYKDTSFVWMDTIITKMGNQKYSFCYYTNLDNLDICAINKDYTIKPSMEVNQSPTITVKKGLEKGSIISFDINKDVENELPLIIKYIKSKDINIVNLIELIKE